MTNFNVRAGPLIDSVGQQHARLQSYHNVSNSYYKFISHEKRRSKRDRVLNNLDRVNLEMSAYPFIIPNSSK